ncbi:MAG: hypothetical protein A3I75_05550 [Deltaproteobacteria bacterium RIFCSPLOWO2_02_FULL_50_16]|nr:MAG: hypothetical protein A3B79_01630 [Deltaproteobacteria bacterium RIFCSPHIGHO2_02_FULL_50_15]OGQ58130.1 MAG: hypothetical protein A3I75_05550 [Deltaproteobacteria bacterium RIFCSPLOWO2_02_FULL_50_16]OGQ68100.1 MAG: hypothetical protein A3F89_01260 [Deltaproteobacteria bacterium RIFCSPLOWO2_12_FULL_50_11]
MNENEFSLDVYRSLSELERREYLLRAYYDESDPAKAFLQKIIDGSGEIEKITLIRSLKRIHEKRSIQYLIALLSSDNDRVFEETCEALKNNQYEAKGKEILPYLEKSKGKMLIFIIRMLGEWGERSAIVPLVLLLPSADYKVKIDIIKSLHFLRDVRCVPAIRPFCDDPDETLRYLSLVTLGDLFELDPTLQAGSFVRHCHDASPRLRKVALWIVGKAASKRFFKLLVHFATKDEDHHVREEAVRQLGRLKTRKIITPLVTVLSYDTHDNVRLQADLVLSKISHHYLAKGLHRLLHHSDEKIRSRVISRLGNLHYTGHQYPLYLEKLLRDENTPMDLKAAAIEAMGAIGTPRLAGFLEEQVVAMTRLSYYALASLTRIWDRNEVDFPLRLLKIEGINPLLQQIILRHFLRKTESRFLNQDVIDVLKSKIHDKNMNIRYLVVQILAKVNIDVIFQDLVTSLTSEEHPTVKEAIIFSLRKGLNGQPGPVIRMLRQLECDNPALDVLCLFLRNTVWLPKTYLEICQALLDVIQRCPQEKRNQYFLALFSFVQNRSISLDDIISLCTDDDQKRQLLQFFDQIVPLQRLQYSVNALEGGLEDTDPVVVNVTIHLLGFSQNQQALHHLLKFALGQKKDPVFQKAVTALQRLVWEARP